MSDRDPAVGAAEPGRGGPARQGQLREIETRLFRRIVTEFGSTRPGWRWT